VPQPKYLIKGMMQTFENTSYGCYEDFKDQMIYKVLSKTRSGTKYHEPLSFYQEKNTQNV
jgi:hypothetical protein